MHTLILETKFGRKTCTLDSSKYRSSSFGSKDFEEAQLHEPHIPGLQVKSAGRSFGSKLLCIDLYKKQCIMVYNGVEVINLFKKQ